MTAPRILTGLLTAFGLSPQATNTPVAPAAPSPVLSGVLEWVRREFNKTFANETPTIAYNPAANKVIDGSIVGILTPVDSDSTTFTYTATDPPHGKVVVDPNGTFTYTPDPVTRARTHSTSPSATPTADPTSTACPGCSTP